MTSIDLMLFDKVETDAGGRGATEMYTWDILLSTHGVGVGLGSNQGYTTPGYILSNTGLIGGLLAMFLVFRIRSSTRSVERSALRDTVRLRVAGSFLAGVCLAAFIGVQALFEPLMWLAVAILLGLTLNVRRTYTGVHSPRPGSLSAQMRLRSVAQPL